MLKCLRTSGAKNIRGIYPQNGLNNYLKQFFIEPQIRMAVGTYQWICFLLFMHSKRVEFFVTFRMGEEKVGIKNLLIHHFIIWLCIWLAADVKQHIFTYPFAEWRQFFHFIHSFAWFMRSCVSRILRIIVHIQCSQIFAQISWIDFGKIRRTWMKNANEGNELLRKQLSCLWRL